MICMVCMIARKDGFLQTMHSRKTMQIMHFMQRRGRENGLPFFLRGEYFRRRDVSN